MEKLVIEHKEVIKRSIGYLLAAAVMAAVLVVAGDQFRLSVGTVVLLLALAVEVFAGASGLIQAFSKDIIDEEGFTVQNVFGSKTFYWKDLKRFEIHWDYAGKRLVKKEEIDAPYILLKFENPKKKIRLDYLEEADRCIRMYYGQPHVDNWTNVGK